MNIFQKLKDIICNNLFVQSKEKEKIGNYKLDEDNYIIYNIFIINLFKIIAKKLANYLFFVI